MACALAWVLSHMPTGRHTWDNGRTINVTVKGGGAQQGYFDWTISLPFLVLAGINVAAFGIGAARLDSGISTRFCNPPRLAA